MHAAPEFGGRSGGGPNRATDSLPPTIRARIDARIHWGKASHREEHGRKEYEQSSSAGTNHLHGAWASLADHYQEHDAPFT